MIGLLLAVLYFAFARFFGGSPDLAAYQGALNLWFWWVAVFAALISLFGVIFVVIAAIAGASVGYALTQGRIGVLLGMLGLGGGATVLFFGKHILKYGSALFGIYLLKSAWAGGAWNYMMLIFGVGLVLLSFLVKASSRSNSEA